MRDRLLELVERHVHLVHPLPLAGVRRLPPAARQFVRLQISRLTWVILQNHIFNSVQEILSTSKLNRKALKSLKTIILIPAQIRK